MGNNDVSLMSNHRARRRVKSTMRMAPGAAPTCNCPTLHSLKLAVMREKPVASIIELVSIGATVPVAIAMNANGAEFVCAQVCIDSIGC